MTLRSRQLKTPNLRQVSLVCGFPDMGFVGKQSVDYLIQELKAELFRELYSSHFPPHVLIRKDGTVELMKNEFYYWKNPEGAWDLVFFTGNTQAASPEGQFEVVEEVLNLAQKYGVQRIFTLSAHVVESRSPDKPPKVYGAVTHVELVKLLEKHGIALLERGLIEGVQGLLLGEARLRGMEGLCLLGETPAFTTPSGRPIVDAKSARAVLEVLTKLLGIQVSMAELEKQAKLTEEFILKLEKLEQSVLEKMVKARPPGQSYYV